VTLRIALFLVAATVSQSAFAFPLTSRSAVEPTLKRPATDQELSGMISMGCSGAVVRFKEDPAAKALVLTNGHCVGFVDPGDFYSDRPYARSMRIYSRDGRSHRFSTTRIVYATMTVTDIAIVELNATYAQLSQLGIDSYQIAGPGAAVGDDIRLVSGFFQTSEECDIDAIIYELREADWTFRGSYKYSRCPAGHGTSGSPLISRNSGQIVGINNTRNDDGERCTFNNPCEVDEEGNITIDYMVNYGQRTDLILACIDAAGAFDLQVDGCELLGSN
jgi:hypothetical protein